MALPKLRIISLIFQWSFGTLLFLGGGGGVPPPGGQRSPVGAHVCEDLFWMLGLLLGSPEGHFGGLLVIFW